MTTADGMQTTGTNIFLAGLILQLISFALFTTLYLVFLLRVYVPH